MNNMDKYKADLRKLIDLGNSLMNAIQLESVPKEFHSQLKALKLTKEKEENFLKSIPSFKTNYQSWYSESLAIIKFLLPDRTADFKKFYERSKTRKVLNYDSYTIEDYLQNISRNDGSVTTAAGIEIFLQQLEILKAVERRFETSLFDIEQLVQADLFDSEIDGAKELYKSKFFRAAGVVAGVVLEKHLGRVCKNHSVIPAKRNPTINDFNEQLKNNGVLDTPTWRSIGLYADIRNICGHGKGAEPTDDQVKTLIDGVDRLLKTLF